MRFAFQHPDVTREKGVRARADMIEKFRPDVVARVVMSLIRQIETQLLQDPKMQSFAATNGKLKHSKTLENDL
jgi:CRISPR/Cas system-associated endonuclease Cas1